MGCLLFHSPNQIIHCRKMSKTDADVYSEVNSSSPCLQNINDPVSIQGNIIFNPLGLALWRGCLNDFRYLIEKSCASPKLMEKLFQKQGFCGIELIIEKGHSELFQYYLPIFIMDFRNSEQLQRPLVHEAVLLGRIEIVCFVHQYFSLVEPPPAFSLNFVDQNTGENSALVACRSLNFELIQYLNEVCLADFGLINFKQENALMIFVEANKGKAINMQVWRYLIEKCDIDVVWNFYQVLAAIDDEEVFNDFVSELEKYGILVNTEEVTRLKEDKSFSDSDVDITAISCISSIDIGVDSLPNESFYFTKYINN